MKTYNGLPLFEIEFNDEESIFNNISFVTEPAIKETFIQLSKQDDERIQLKINEEKRIVSGPALIPGMPIYRNQGGRAFYIKWSSDTIKQVMINFFKNHRNTEGNVEHQLPFAGVTFFESYILDKERGIAPKEFDNLPTGTWILSAKVNNDNVWQMIKDGTLTGFSIDMANVNFKEETDEELTNLEEFFKYLSK